MRAQIELGPSARGSWAPASQSIGSPRPEGTLVLLRAAVRACVCLTVLAGLLVVRWVLAQAALWRCVPREKWMILVCVAVLVLVRSTQVLAGAAKLPGLLLPW